MIKFKLLIFPLPKFNVKIFYIKFIQPLLHNQLQINIINHREVLSDNKVREVMKYSLIKKVSKNKNPNLLTKGIENMNKFDMFFL